jgi:hypothetical protein
MIEVPKKAPIIRKANVFTYNGEDFSSIRVDIGDEGGDVD